MAALLGRAVGPRPMSGCGPGTHATCSAVLSGALEAYPLLGTTPGVLGELVAGYRISPAEDFELLSVTPKSRLNGDRGLLHILLFLHKQQEQYLAAPAIRLCGRGNPPICAADLSNKDVIFPAMPL